MSARDLPPVPSGIDNDLAQMLRRMREEIHELVRNGGGGGGSSGSNTTTVIVGGGGGSGGTTPDLTPPPDVSSLAVFAAFSNILVTWSGIAYPQGHGHKQTLIYAVKKDPSDPTMPVFADAQLVATAPDALTMIAIPSEMNTRWHVWAKFETVDGEVSVNPSGGTNGYNDAGTFPITGKDISQMLDVLTQAAEDPSLPYSKFTLKGDLIYVSDATGAATQFFNVVTTPITVDGITVDPGVYMKSAFIANGQIKNAMLGNAIIDDAKIIELSAAKFTGGEMKVGSYLQSTNFLPVGSVGFPNGRGWRVRADGSADFQAADIRGTLTAAQIDGTGLTIKDVSGNVLINAGATPWLKSTIRVGSDTGPTLAEIETGVTGPAGPTGSPGANGTRTAVMRLYQWAGGVAPSSPSGTSVYTWATGAFTDPSGIGLWTQTPTAPSSHQTLYIAEHRYADALTSATTTISWAPTIFVGGKSGDTGLTAAVTGYGETFGIFSSNPWNGAVDDALANSVIAAMRGDSTRIVGDTVTLRTSGGTKVETRYWTGSSWAAFGVTMSGNLLVGGTISGQTNFNISGFGKIEGGASYTIPDPASPGSTWTTTCALIANTTHAQTNGAVFYSGNALGSSSFAGAIGVGHNGGTGLFGVGQYGVIGYGDAIAVSGYVTNPSATAAVYGSSGASAPAVYGNNTGGGYGGRFSSIKSDAGIDAVGGVVAGGVISTNAFVEAKASSANSAYLHASGGGAYFGHYNGTGLYWAVWCDSATNTTVNSLRLSGMSFGADPGGSTNWLNIKINGADYRIAVKPV